MKNHKPEAGELPSTRQLVRSTLIAFVSAVVLLVTIILPAEYAIDPTGIGNLVGLTRMGEIKTQLAAEAAQAEADAQEKKTIDPAAIVVIDPTATSTEKQNTPKIQTITKTLQPDASMEIKVEMLKDVTVDFQWTADGGALNYDTHGDGYDGTEYKYDKGKEKIEQSGTLTAEGDGLHGWYWRNRSGNTVELSVTVTGDFIDFREI